MQIIMDGEEIKRTLRRLSHEIIESHPDLEELLLIGIKTRGVPLAERLAHNIEDFAGTRVMQDEIDITFYRDDLVQKFSDPHVQTPVFTHAIEGREVIIVDDVLYTGRTVRAAMDAILKAGRAKRIQLATLVDRGHRELPIRPDYIGKNIPSAVGERVSVRLEEIDGEDQVFIQ